MLPGVSPYPFDPTFGVCGCSAPVVPRDGLQPFLAEDISEDPAQRSDFDQVAGIDLLVQRAHRGVVGHRLQGVHRRPLVRPDRGPALHQLLHDARREHVGLPRLYHAAVQLRVAPMHPAVLLRPIAEVRDELQSSDHGSDEVKGQAPVRMLGKQRRHGAGASQRDGEVEQPTPQVQEARACLMVAKRADAVEFKVVEAQLPPALSDLGGGGGGGLAGFAGGLGPSAESPTMWGFDFGDSFVSFESPDIAHLYFRGGCGRGRGPVGVRIPPPSGFGDGGGRGESLIAHELGLSIRGLRSIVTIGVCEVRIGREPVRTTSILHSHLNERQRDAVIIPGR